MIPANKTGHGNLDRNEKLRVCAYCRVSTNSLEQENSFESQINIIKKK